VTHTKGNAMWTYRGYEIQEEAGLFRAYLDKKKTSFFGATLEQVQNQIDRFKRAEALKND
jgi:hypothetical protein